MRLAVLLVLASSAWAPEALAQAAPAANYERVAPAPVRDNTHDHLLRVGTGILIGGYLANIPIALLTSFVLFFESPEPCYEGFCGIWETYGLSFIPIAGPSIWAALVLDTSGNWGSIVGFIVSAVQATGLGLLIAGIVRANEQTRITPVITPTGAAMQVAVSF